MTTLTVLPWDAVLRHGEKITTTSLMVSDVFGKNHRHVLGNIRDLTEPESGLSEEFAERNFSLSSYLDSTGRKLPMYELTKDGFTLLVMGYTGAKAISFKVAYINQFNEMQNRLERSETERNRVTERAYFERYPDRREIRCLALRGEPYWYIGTVVRRSAGTVGKAVAHMIKWGMMDSNLLRIARIGASVLWAHRRKYRQQLQLF